MESSIKAALFGCLITLCLACGPGPSEAELIEHGQLYLQQGEYQPATIEFRNALQRNPQNSSTRFLLGLAYLELGDLAAAEKELLKAGGQGEADDNCLPALSRAYAMQGKNEELQALVLDKLTDQNALGEVLAAQGIGNLLNGDEASGGAQINEALELNPESLYVKVARARLSLTRWEVDFARQEAQAVLDVDASYAPAWSLLGDLERHAGNIEAAEAAYSKAIENYNANLQDLFQRVGLRVQLGQLQGAQQDLDQLKKRAPNSAEIFYIEGLLLLKNGAIQEANDAFQVALSRDDKHANALFYRALTLMKLGKWDLAETSAEGFHSMAPDSLQGLKLLAKIKLWRGEIERASELLSPLADAETADPEALSLLTEVLLLKGEKEQAINLLQRIVQLQPELEEAKLQLAAVLMDNAQRSEGLTLIETVLEENPESESAYELLVSSYMKAGDNNAALSAARRLQSAAPESTLALQLIAAAQIASGDTVAAAATLKQIEKVSPGDRAANHALAELSITDKNYVQARTYYDRVLVRQPDELATLLRLVRLDALERRPRDMEARLRLAVSAHPSSAMPRLMLARYYYAIGEKKKVGALLGELTAEQSKLPDALQLRGLVGLDEGNYEAAFSVLDPLAKLRPQSADAQYLLARAYAGLGNYKFAQRYLAKAAGLEPGNFALGVAYARALVAAGDADKAAPLLDRLGKLEPDSPDVPRLKALLARREGDQESSEALLQEIFREDPSTVNLMSVVGQLWYQGDREEALVLQQRWLAENPGDSAAAHALAGAYSLDGKTEEATTEFEKLLKRDSSNVVALNELAWLLRKSQKIRALEYATLANELKPDNPALMDTLAVALYYNGEYRRAREVMQEALLQAPGEPALRYHEAMIDVALGEEERALITLRSILSDDVKFSEKQDAEELLAKLQP